MDSVEYIQEHLRPLEVLNYYNFKHITEGEKEIRACCGIHNGNNPSGFVWNKENNLWYCYTGECGGGDVFTLIQSIDNIPFKDAVKKAADILGLNISEMKINDQTNRILKDQREWLTKQLQRHTKKNNKNYELPFTKYSDSDERFTRFDNKILQDFNAKFCKVFPTEDYMLYNKLVIPIVQNEKTVAVALRDLTGQCTPKWFYYPSGIKTGDMLYNIDTINKEVTNLTEIILAEGIFDVWAYHRIGIDNVVAIFGSNIKEEQYRTLMRLNLNIVFSFDNDKAGNKCLNKSKELFKNKVDVKTITLPEGKDPADCTEKELLSAYINRT